MPSAWRKLTDNKLNVITYYGGRCKCCWQSVLEVLLVVRDDGTHAVAEKKDSEYTYDQIVKQRFPSGYSIMCTACAVARRQHGTGKCPHEELSAEVRVLLRAVNAKVQSILYPSPD